MTTKKPARPQSRKVVEVYSHAKNPDEMAEFSNGPSGFLVTDCPLSFVSLKRVFPRDRLYRITIERITERKKK